MGLSTPHPLPFSYGPGVSGAARRTTWLAKQARSLFASFQRHLARKLLA